MTTDILPIEDDDGAAPQRLHPAFFITGLGSAAKGSFGIIAAGAYFGISGRWWLLGVLAALFVGLTLATLWLRWIRFSYRISDQDIVIESGLVSTQHRSIPFDRIQDVNIEQGPIARLIGIARVRLETGATASRGEDDGVLEAIALDRANDLRDRIRAYRSGRPATIDIVGDNTAAGFDETPLFAMSPRRVLRSGLYNFSLAVFAVLGGLFQAGGDLLPFDPFSRAFWRFALDSGSPLADYVLAHRWVSALAGVTTLIAIGVATGIVRTVLSDHHFRLTRTETGLRRRRGLLTLTDMIIPVRRVQAAIIGTGPIRARAGWHSLKLQSLARDEASQGDHAVVPFGQLEEIAPVLAEIGMALPDAATDWRRVDRAYAVQFIAVLSLPLLVTALVAAFGITPALVGSAAILVVMAARWFAWRRYRYAHDGQRIMIRRGWWRRRTVILPLANIQSVDVAHDFVDRLFGVAAVKFGVAGGSGLSGHEVAALPLAKAYALRDELLSRFA